MNNNNIKIKPISNPEALQVVELLKKIIKEGNGILNFIETVSNIEIENPNNYESIKKCTSPSQRPVTMFSTSPIKSRKSLSSGIYTSDNGKTKFNNRKILTFVKYSLIMKLQGLIKHIKQWDNIISIDTSDIVENCLQCVVFVVSMSIIVEDTLASTEEGVNDKGKITVKGKRYIMNTIYKIRLYLISLINNIKTVTADDILYKYHPQLLEKDLIARKQKTLKKISDINNIINNELQNYSSNGKNNDQVLKGYLQKKKENEKFMSGFKKKYFILTHKALMYSDKEISSNSTLGTSKFLMFCDYDGIERVQEEQAKRKYCMRLYSSKDPNQSMFLAAGDEIEEILWFNEIRDKMYINSNYYTSEDENVTESESERYHNISDVELNDLIRLINLEEKIRTNIMKYIFINKMNEIIRKISNTTENRELDKDE
eukprot:jgi/Orpsp1_1/1191250/evm.model.d7180000084381.1